MGQSRFYLSHYENQPDREVLFQDIGSLLKISGVVFQGMGSTVILLSPSGEFFDPSGDSPVRIARPDAKEWSEIIRQSDDPEVFIGEVGGINKILHRKLRYEISGQVQQQVWARDNFQCMFCKRKMGEVQLSVDHWIPLELGGDNDTSNYLSACRGCNKKKGMMHPKDFCKKFGYDFEALSSYLEWARSGAAP